MSNTENELRERIKELTCLYEVSSIIVNADKENLKETFLAIAKSVQKGLQFPKYTEIIIQTSAYHVQTKDIKNYKNCLTSEVKIFNKSQGKIAAFLKNDKFSFLNEEKKLLDSIALKIGNLLELIEIQENERAMKKQIERADRLAILGEITAGIAHELNTPLANILGFAELLKDNIQGSHKASDDLDKIISNAIFSREIVKKLMYFACEMPQTLQTINIVPCIKNAISLLDATFRKKRVKYIVKIESEELFLKADTIQITQIIFNLVMNAIYFSPDKGLVAIEASSSKKNIVLKISDEGPGISEDVIDKIFQPFFTTKPSTEGTGLGLSVVHGIVASHKGVIFANNNTDKGATFVVKLPKQ